MTGQFAHLNRMKSFYSRNTSTLPIRNFHVYLLHINRHFQWLIGEITAFAQMEFTKCSYFQEMRHIDFKTWPLCVTILEVVVVYTMYAGM